MKTFILSLAFLVLTIAAQASETPATATAADTLSAPVAESVAHESQATSNLTDRLYLNYFAIYHGAPLNEMGSTYTVDAKGKRSKFSSINLDSDVTAAYMLTKDVGVGFDIPFLLVPVRGQGIIMGDAGLKAFDKKTVFSNGLVISTNLILQAPTSQSSKDRGLDLGIKTTPSIRYSVPASRFTVGTWTEAKEYAGVFKEKTFKLWAGPYVNYRLTSTLSLNVEYEMEWHHDVGEKAMHFATYQTDLQPGLVWNVTPKILVNPYVQFFTTNRATFDTAALGAVVSASAF